MKSVKGLFFDRGGTVFDWKNTAREKIQELVDAKAHTIDGSAFANDWREGEREPDGGNNFRGCPLGGKIHWSLFIFL